MADEPIDDGSGPSSHDTCGRFPAQEVAQTFPGQGTDPQAKTEAAKT